MVSEEQDGVIRVPAKGTVLARVSAVIHIVRSFSGLGIGRRSGRQAVLGRVDPGVCNGTDERATAERKKLVLKQTFRMIL